MREKVNSLEPIRLSLSIVAVDYVGAVSPIDLTLKISEILSTDRSKKHVEILTYATFRSIALSHKLRK